MIPKDKVEAIVSNCNKIEKELSSSDLDPKKYVEKSKEYSELKGIIDYAKNYLNFEKERKDLENIIEDKKSDTDMVNLAKKELNDLSINYKNSENKLKIFLLPKDQDDKKNV